LQLAQDGNVVTIQGPPCGVDGSMAASAAELRDFPEMLMIGDILHLKILFKKHRC
jgi:hypothetical protein